MAGVIDKIAITASSHINPMAKLLKGAVLVKERLPSRNTASVDSVRFSFP